MDLDGHTTVQWQGKRARAPFLYVYTLEKWSKNINSCQILDFLQREQCHALGKWEAFLYRNTLMSLCLQSARNVNDWVTHHMVTKQQHWATKIQGCTQTTRRKTIIICVVNNHWFKALLSPRVTDMTDWRTDSPTLKCGIVQTHIAVLSFKARGVKNRAILYKFQILR